MRPLALLVTGVAIAAALGASGALAGQRKGARKAAKKSTKQEKGGEGGHAFVLMDNDAVILRDGTRITGTILCAGQAAVTILTPDGEKTIAREKIERIIKNTKAGFPKKFKAEEQDGHKYLVEEPAEGEEGMGAPAKPGPAARPVPKGKAPAKATKPARPGAPPKRRPGARPKQPRAPGRLPKLNLPKDPAKLKALLDRLKRQGKLDQILKNPQALKMLREALKGK